MQGIPHNITSDKKRIIAYLATIGITKDDPEFSDYLASEIRWGKSLERKYRK
jgi:hypothetical protein